MKVTVIVILLHYLLWLILIIKTIIDFMKAYMKYNKYLKKEEIRLGNWQKFIPFDIIFYKENKLILNYYNKDEGFKGKFDEMRKISIRYVLLLVYFACTLVILIIGNIIFEKLINL